MNTHLLFWGYLFHQSSVVLSLQLLLAVLVGTSKARCLQHCEEEKKGKMIYWHAFSEHSHLVERG